MTTPEDAYHYIVCCPAIERTSSMWLPKYTCPLLFINWSYALVRMNIFCEKSRCICVDDLLSLTIMITCLSAEKLAIVSIARCGLTESGLGLAMRDHCVGGSRKVCIQKLYGLGRTGMGLCV